MQIPNFSKGRRRHAVNLSTASLVKTEPLCAETGFCLVITPAEAEMDLIAWAAACRETLLGWLKRHGAILFRGFSLGSAQTFRDFARAIHPDLLSYVERAAPRKEVLPGIFTSTELPDTETIPLHHEMSYAHNWPTWLWLFCELPATSGGCTPIASERHAGALLDEEIKRRFRRKKLMYVRNFGEGLDMGWREAFQADDRAEVETYCRRAGMEVEWRAGDRLRIRTIRQVFAVHPETGEELWFNHAHLFHQSNLCEEVRAGLLQVFAPDELPRNVFYGDGSPIEASILDEIRANYNRVALRFEWERDDLLMLDNFLAVHGRDPFTPPRRVLAAMAGLYTDPQISRLSRS